MRKSRDNSAEFVVTGEIRTEIPCYFRKISPRKRLARPGRGQMLSQWNYCEASAFGSGTMIVMVLDLTVTLLPG